MPRKNTPEAIEKQNKWRKDWVSANPAYYGQLRARRSAAGNCTQCNDIRSPSSKMCEKHWFYNVAKNRLGSGGRWRELRDKFISQGAACAYTGIPLVIGVNASLDHISPISRFPELKGDIKNVEWVTLQVNFAKRDSTKEEFIDFCKLMIAGMANRNK